MCFVANVDGSPRFCIDYRNIIDHCFGREAWPMPDIEFYIDTVDGAKFITVYDVQRESLLSNTNSKKGLSQNGISNFKRQRRL